MDEATPIKTSAAHRSGRVETIIDSEAVLLRYHSDTKIVHHEFRRFLHGEPLREVLEKGLEIFRARGACKWLSDDRRNGPITTADAEWARQTWSPRVIAAGWKYWAVVLPEKVLGQMNMKRRMRSYEERGVTARAFSDAGEARRWLEEQP